MSLKGLGLCGWIWVDRAEEFLLEVEGTGAKAWIGPGLASCDWRGGDNGDAGAVIGMGVQLMVDC